MKVYYFWDAYCGWCYGFESIFTPFLKEHPELDVIIISGGLFDQGKPIRNYPHMKEANQLNIDAEEIVTIFKKEQEKGVVHGDIQQTHQWQIPSFPTVVAEVDGQFYDLKGNATIIESLEKNYRHLKDYLAKK